MDDKTHDQVLADIFNRHDPQGEFAHLRAKHRYLNEQGQEIPDPVPLAPPIGYNPQPSMIDQVRDMVRMQLSLEADAAGVETFEDADDFEVGDDFEAERNSPYEEHFEPTSARELRRRATEAEKPKPVPEAPPAPPEGAKPPPQAEPPKPS